MKKVFQNTNADSILYQLVRRSALSSPERLGDLSDEGLAKLEAELANCPTKVSRRRNLFNEAGFAGQSAKGFLGTSFLHSQMSFAFALALAPNATNLSQFLFPDSILYQTVRRSSVAAEEAIILSPTNLLTANCRLMTPKAGATLFAKISHQVPFLTISTLFIRQTANGKRSTENAFLLRFPRFLRFPASFFPSSICAGLFLAITRNILVGYGFGLESVCFETVSARRTYGMAQIRPEWSKRG